MSSAGARVLAVNGGSSSIKFALFAGGGEPGPGTNNEATKARKHEEVSAVGGDMTETGSEVSDRVPS